MRTPGAERLRAIWPYLAHLPIVGWTFRGPLFLGLVPYFRDIAYFYYPNAVFLERSLADGVWPLWNPTSDAGAPFLATDVADLILVSLTGASGFLRFGAPLHQLAAMAGATWLGRTLGLGATAAWAAGLLYGLTGYFLSSVNLVQLNHAAAWAPWVVAALLRLWAAPTPRRAAALGVLAAGQLSTLGVEIGLQSVLVGAALLRGRPDRRRIASLAAAGVVALLLAMPALLGVRALVAGTPRSAGLPREAAFTFSLHPASLLEVVVPQAFGDVHTFSEHGYWGQPFFPDGYPYLLSLYLGPALLWLALRSGPGPARRRLLGLAVLGLLLALGRYGPLAWLLEPLMRHFRGPVKFLFLTTFSLVLLAAFAVDRARRETLGRSRLAQATAALVMALAAAIAVHPELPGRVLGALVPELLGQRALVVIAAHWPGALAGAGAFLLGAALATSSRTLAPLAAVLVGLDLLIASGQVNLATAPSFFALRPGTAQLLQDAGVDASARIFSYGAGHRDLRWAPEVALRNNDVPLYAVDRQALTPRLQVIDGLEGAFDEDRAGWAPPGSTLTPHERVPALYRRHHALLRLAAVRFVLSFHPLPEDLLEPRGELRLPELMAPLRLYQLRDPLPRAFAVWRYAVEPDPRRLQAQVEALGFDPRELVLLDAPPPEAASPAAMAPAESIAVSFERVSPHEVRLTAPGVPALLVVSEGYSPDWVARASDGRRPLLRANGRYWAIPSRGGGETITVRYEPRWRPMALAALGLGGLAAIALGLWPRRRATPEREA